MGIKLKDILNNFNHLNECVCIAKQFGNDMILGKNRDRNYNPTLKAVRDMTGYGVEILYVIDNETDWSEGLNNHGIGLVNSALFVKRDEKEVQKKKTARRSKDGVRIREVLGKKSLSDAVDCAVNFHGGIKGHTLIGDGKRIVSIENTSRLSPIVKIKDLTKEPLVRTNHGLEHPEAGYQVRAQNKLWTSSQLVMNLNQKELILYLIPDAVEFIGVENKLPNGYTPSIKFTIRKYKSAPDGKHDNYVTTSKRKKKNALRK